MNNILSENEKLFCELFVNGTAPYAGNAAKCFAEVFKDKSINVGHKARTFINQPKIQSYVDELSEASVANAVSMKRYLTENLSRILDETSTATYYDRRGTALSPAPLRSVAVSAAKALMEMYPVREAQVSKVNIENGNGEGGIVFNVIVPGAKPTEASTTAE